MKVMVVGSGGREHALIKSIKQNPKVEKIYALPGNGGIAMDAICVNIGAKDIDAMVEFAKAEGIDFAVIAPDDPLVLGAVDALNACGVKCFGPKKDAAAIEGSKVFSKGLMKKYGIPTAAYEVFDNPESALAYIEKCEKFPTVIKADGLALGKGVIIAQDKQQAVEAVKSIMEDKIFGASGSSIVIEEFLTGPEVSVLSFTDGNCVVPMISSMDHKRALDGDKGLNTGGMGTIAPNPFYTKEIADECMEKIFIPTMRAMNEEGRKFKGCLYFGLMLTENGPYVIEYNCRFGDPETQVVLPMLKTDLLDIMLAVEEEKLADIDIEFEDGACCCVIIASGGYPVTYKKGCKITFSTGLDAYVYHAGTKEENGELVTNGGRVFGVACRADSLEDAVSEAYRQVKKISFKDAYYRRDIGRKALENMR